MTRLYLKEFLREQCLPKLHKQYAYIDIVTLRTEIEEANLKCKPTTLNNYMKEMEQSGIVSNAGKGWYSFINKPYRLEKEAVKDLIALVTKEFPFLGFASWSTKQVNRHMHHLLGKYVIYVQMDKDIMAVVSDFLKQKEYNVYLNPTKREIEKNFSVSNDDKTVIVRPLPSRSPVDNHAAGIEKILVDLRKELETVPLMSVGEFKEMARKTVTSERVNMSEMLSYAKRRKISAKDIMNDPEYIISNLAPDWR